jgi:hypothetical protein
MPERYRKSAHNNSFLANQWMVIAMKKRYTTVLSIDECKSRIKDCIHFLRFNFGQEQFVGWIRFGIFSIAYRNGKIRMYNPIFNKSIGRIYKKNGKTYVDFSLFKGLTDIFSVFYIFIGSLLIISLVAHGLNLLGRISLSVLCCIFASSITWFFSWITEEGRDGEGRLSEFLERNLELEKLEK